jgi:hypothetical protein
VRPRPATLLSQPCAREVLLAARLECCCAGTVNLGALAPAARSNCWPIRLLLLSVKSLS